MLRKKLLQIKISGDEDKLINNLADHFGLDRSGTIRLLVRKACREEGLLPGLGASDGKRKKGGEKTMPPPLKESSRL